MRYLKVSWHHTNPEYPVTIWSEIGDDGYEVRKVESFLDGRLGFADANTSKSGTELGEIPVPSIEEIASQGEFSPEVITAKAFERKWGKARRPAVKFKKPQIRAYAPGSKGGKGAKRYLGIANNRSTWVVVTARTHQVIATEKTREGAIKQAKSMLQSATINNARTVGKSGKKKGSPKK
jgi:hypothetical protein